MARARKKLWVDESGTRYFLIPTTWQFPVGDLLIRSMNGYAWRIDEFELRAFEISEVQAHEHLQRKVERTFEKMLGKFKEGGALIPDTVGDESVFNTADLGNTFKTLADLLEGTTNIHSSKRSEAKTYLHHLDGILRAQGQDFDIELDSLVDEVHALYSPTQKSEIGALTHELRTIADLLSGPQPDLEAVVRTWERMTGGPLHLDQQRAKKETERRKEIRASADDAIARSLKAFGFDTD